MAMRLTSPARAVSLGAAASQIVVSRPERKLLILQAQGATVNWGTAAESQPFTLGAGAYVVLDQGAAGAQVFAAGSGATLAVLEVFS